MRASDIIRELLCLIDVIDRQQAQAVVQPQPVQTIEPVAAVAVEIPMPQELDDGPRRFKQIFDILAAQRDQQYANSPAEVIAGVESVTTDAGGGLNGPKNPADMRSNSVSMYPNYQAK